MMLIDERTPDGSRRFARLRTITPWEVVRDHVLLLENAKLVNFVGGQVTHGWLDFSFRGHRFLIHSHENLLHLYVHDPQCSDLILFQVGQHFEKLKVEEGQ
jgi:hypothetical protein